MPASAICSWEAAASSGASQLDDVQMTSGLWFSIKRSNPGLSYASLGSFTLYPASFRSSSGGGWWMGVLLVGYAVDHVASSAPWRACCFQIVVFSQAWQPYRSFPMVVMALLVSSFWGSCPLDSFSLSRVGLAPVRGSGCWFQLT